MVVVIDCVQALQEKNDYSEYCAIYLTWVTDASNFRLGFCWD